METKYWYLSTTVGEVYLVTFPHCICFEMYIFRLLLGLKLTDGVYLKIHSNIHFRLTETRKSHYER